MHGLDRAARPASNAEVLGEAGVDRGEREILDRMKALAGQVTAEMADVMLAEVAVSGMVRDAPAKAELRALARQYLDGFVVVAQAGTGQGAGMLAEVRNLAAQRARRLVPLAPQLHSLLIAQREILTAISRAAGADAHSRSAALALKAKAFDYGSTVITTLADAYIDTVQGELVELEAARRGLVDALLAGTDGGPELARRATVLGFDAESPHVVALVAVDDRRERQPYPMPPRWAIPAVARAAGRTQRTAFVIARDTELIALLEPAAHREVLQRAGADIRQASDAALRAGIAGPFTGLAEFAGAYEQARRALRHTSADRPVLEGPGDLLLFDELAAASGDAAELVPAATRAVLSDPPLRAALDAFIAADLNVATAAKALYLHPNSLRYRLWRITKCTGRDLRKVSDLLELIAACRVLDGTPATDC